SRREIPEEKGLAHFMEHMVFKGTERRSAEAIAREMDSVGGMLDAFTSKEQICFNAKILAEHLPIAFDVIADLVLRPKRDLEQVHLCIGVPSVPLGHEDRFAVAVLNNLLGGGMSSRLFQNIREKQGLAYAVFSELTPYSDAGMMTVYAGTAAETVGKVIDLTIQEFRALKESPVT